MQAVVIVNFNDTDATCRAVRSIPEQPDVLNIVVDNGSVEDPTTAIETHVGSNTTVLRLQENRGYAAGLNAGVSLARSQGATHVLLLNNDATLDAGTLVELQRFDDRHPGSILAPLITYLDAPQTVWSAGGYMAPPNLRNHHHGLGRPAKDFDTPARVEWATGCALYVSLSTFDRVGPLDEAYFLYLEDVDWCLRAQTTGVSTWLVPTALVHHEVSRTTSGLASGHVRYYGERNHYRLAWMHGGPWRKVAVATEAAWTLTKAGVRTLTSAQHRHDDWYHARTRGIRDAALGRFGPDPTAAGGPSNSRRKVSV